MGRRKKLKVIKKVKKHYQSSTLINPVNAFCRICNHSYKSIYIESHEKKCLKLGKYVLPNVSNEFPFSCGIEGCQKQSTERKGILIHIQRAHKDVIEQEFKDKNAEDIANEDDTDESKPPCKISESFEFSDESDIHVESHDSLETELNIKEETLDTIDNESEKVADSNWEDLDLDFLLELNGMEFTDMKIECQGKAVNCHRRDLCKNSPVLNKAIHDPAFNETR